MKHGFDIMCVVCGSHNHISKMIKNELGSTNVCEHCQNQKIKKQEIKRNFENVFAQSICSILMGLFNDS
jgi:hypothetical protein